MDISPVGRFLPLSVSVALSVVTSVQAQSTAFTYQGQLKNGASAANGLHDFRFRLFDAATGGSQVGTAQCVDNVTVTNGLFTTTVDFGQQFATPVPRFLEIEVRADTGLNCTNTTGYVLLSSRQLLSATPFASHAKSAFSLDAADGSPANALIVDNNGSIGIGTSTPGHSVTIAQTAPTIALQDTDSTTQQVGYVSYRDSANVERAWVGYGTAGDPDFSIVNARTGGDIALTPLAGGNVLLAGNGGRVGVGTSSPTHSVHIATLGPTIALQDTAAASQQAGYISYRDNASVERAWVGYGTPGSPHFSIINARSGGNIVLTPLGGGVVQVPILEITGADLAEKFPASEKIEPGMVVAIDREHAGKLCLSRGTYNRCVAGVVSGANNFSVGAVLGNLPGHEDAPAIALSGRVYVRCDATDSAIEPGDLLTTSATPGHAMKATDRDLSHGAVIGKAMEPLRAGERGLVLVLVNLQ
jgi:hypothetical protein